MAGYTLNPSIYECVWFNDTMKQILSACIQWRERRFLGSANQGINTEACITIFKAIINSPLLQLCIMGNQNPKHSSFKNTYTCTSFNFRYWYTTEKIEQVFDEKYVAAIQDVLRAKIEGMPSYYYNMKRSCQYRLCDTGDSMLSHSMKCDRAAYVFYVCGLDQFILKDTNDADKNLLIKNLEHFHELVKGEDDRLKKEKVIVLLNKVDVFREILVHYH